MNPMTTSFVARLRNRDDAAWFELWTVFGPVIRAQLTRWGRGAVGMATVEDLTQDTLTALSGSIDRFDPDRGARFSTWLLSIAKHVLGDELDRRNALKRGGGKRAASLDESFMGRSNDPQPDAEYERLVAAGMTFHCAPPQLGAGMIRATYGRDPDGNIVELQEIIDPAIPFTLERTDLIGGTV